MQPLHSNNTTSLHHSQAVPKQANTLLYYTKRSANDGGLTLGLPSLSLSLSLCFLLVWRPLLSSLSRVSVHSSSLGMCD